MRQAILHVLLTVVTLFYVTACGVAPSASAQAPGMSPEDLACRTIERRAIEAVNWGMPAVNYDRMYQAMVRDAKGAFNQIVYTVPANAPAKLYWAAVVYDRATHAFIRDLYGIQIPSVHHRRQGQSGADLRRS
jgi:hypothetical protein